MRKTRFIDGPAELPRPCSINAKPAAEHLQTPPLDLSYRHFAGLAILTIKIMIIIIIFHIDDKKEEMICKVKSTSGKLSDGVSVWVRVEKWT